MKHLGVIFDMDGVLVNSYETHWHSWTQTASDYGLTIAPEDFARTFGRTSREIILALWPERFSDAEIAEFDRKKEAHYRENLEIKFPEMEGASELIGSLHEAGFGLAIGSSGPPENVALVGRKIRNGELFQATVNGTEVKKGKPDPQVFLLAGQKLGIEPAKCAVIEDAIAGIEAARRAGMTAIGLTGTTTAERLGERAHRVVTSLRQLTPAVIEELIWQSAGANR
jgi:beta-phosphoglucomutase